MFNNLNIMKRFFGEPTREFNVREIARLVGLSPATASKNLKELVKKGLLKERRDRTFHLYKADLESQAYRDYKTFYTIRKIRDSGLIDSLNRFYLRPTIILFGSAASGMDTETSDIDMVVISEKIRRFPDSARFEDKLGRKLQIFAVTGIKDLNKNLANNVINGITLQGKAQWT